MYPIKPEELRSLFACDQAKNFMTPSMQQKYQKILKEFEADIIANPLKKQNIFKTKKPLSPRNVFVRDPFETQLKYVAKDAANPSCVITGKRIYPGNSCIAIVIKCDGQGYFLRALIKDVETFELLLEHGTITKTIAYLKSTAETAKAV